MASESPNSLALVLSGGGARGAYEAGMIHYLRTMLPPPLRSRRFPIQCGSSVGAINTCFMASTSEDLDYQGRHILELWKDLRPEYIYRRNARALSHFVFETLRGVLHNLTRLDFFKESHGPGAHFHSFFDTAPFADYLRRVIRWDRIGENVRSGLLTAASLVATRMRTGRPEIFLQKGSPIRYWGDFTIHSVDLGPEHAMASAAIPLVFSQIAIGDHFYVDGSVRLNTPLAPAIHLGARKILIVSLYSEDGPDPRPHGCDDRRCPPGLGEHLGKLLNAFFLDRIRYDLEQVERINRLIEASEAAFGGDYLEKVNARLRRPLHRIDCLRISPSVPISSVFADWYDRGRRKDRTLSLMERLFLRIMDVKPAVSLDLLSYLTFERDYLSRVIDLGFEDARKNHDRLCAFLEGT